MGTYTTKQNFSIKRDTNAGETLWSPQLTFSSRRLTCLLERACATGEGGRTSNKITKCTILLLKYMFSC